jgi:hypothetical protein
MITNALTWSTSLSVSTLLIALPTLQGYVSFSIKLIHSYKPVYLAIYQKGVMYGWIHAAPGTIVRTDGQLVFPLEVNFTTIYKSPEGYEPISPALHITGDS